MTVIVSGARSWPREAQDKIHRVLDLCFAYEGDPMLLLHGGAAGADSYAEHWVRNRNQQAMKAPSVVRIAFPAKWSEYAQVRGGKNPAGAIRNRAMLDYALKPEVLNQYGDPLLVAFPLPESKGTVDCMRAARERTISVFDATAYPLSDLEEFLTRG